MTYTKYSCLSMKARIVWAKERLKSKGYNITNTTPQRDKEFIKAVKQFQKDNNFGTNAEIHEQEFLILNKN